jgi:hypothetical protein
MNPELAAHARLDPARPLDVVRLERPELRDEVAKVRMRVASLWEGLGRSRAMTERNRALLTQRLSG